jgi:YD repeat-containing protein
MKKLSLLCFSVFFFFDARSQGEVPVDMYSGTPIIQIPIHTIVAHDISESIALNYNATGVKLEQSPGWYGLGWSLIGGGSISRDVKGTPDDFTDTESGLKGWLYSRSAGINISREIGNFSNSADLSALAPCADETTDYNTINGFNYFVDTEPDMFSYNFGGYSGKFVFDNDGIIRPIPYRDIKIEYTQQSATNKTLTGFKITTDNGFVYSFSLAVFNDKSVTKFLYLNHVTVLKADYELYKNGVVYNAEWKLTRIDSPTGAWVAFDYDAAGFTTQTPVNIGKYIYKNGNTLGATDLNLSNIYEVQEVFSNRYLSHITTSSGVKVDFFNNDGSLEKITISDFRRPAGSTYVKEFKLGYKNVSRKFLESVTEVSGCDDMPPYKFDYISTDNMPDASSNNKDFWGFYNGENNNTNLIPKIYIYPDEVAAERYRLQPIPNYTGHVIIMNGANRIPNSTSCAIGTLNRITYPGGGIVTLIYEGHQYYDAYAGESFTGGGLRIKTVKYFDGIHANLQIIKNFDYKDATGKSSGRLITKPAFAFPAYKWKDPNYFNSTSTAYDKLYQDLAGDDQWKFLTFRTELDLSAQEDTHGSTVGYQVVTVSRVGAGAVKFEYDMPGVFGEIANGNWTATVNKFARPGSCVSLGVVNTGGEWLYPYSPNPNFDYERGLLSRKYEYDLQGKLVRYTDNTYQYIYGSGTQPVGVAGLHYNNYALSEDNSPTNKIFFYGTYSLITNVDRVLKKESVTVYDAIDQTKFVTSSTEYFYESPNHKLLTRTTRTTENSVAYTTKFKYIQDYGAIAGNSEPAVISLRDLLNLNRYSTPIEVVNTIQRSGQPEKVTGASLLKFKAFGTKGIYPEQSLSLSIADPITDFAPSSLQVHNGNYVLVPDPRYDTTATTSDYSPFGLPVSSTGLNKNPSSAVWGYTYSFPVAKISNASAGEFAFSDFETASDAEFQLSNVVYGLGRTGSKSLHPGATLTKAITKAVNSNYYILSLWMKKDVNPISLQITIKDATTTYYTNTFSIQPAGTDFEYFRHVIPSSNFPTTFTVEIKGVSITSSATGSDALVPVMDDIAFYPEAADISMFTYTIPFGASSVTNANGITVFTKYDNLGRVSKVLDKDKNILEKNSYRYGLNGTLVCDFSPPLSFVGESTILKASDNPCAPGAIYKWTIGGNVQYGSQITYTFNSAEPRTITLEVSNTGFATQTVSKTIQVVFRPITVGICAKGVQEFDASDNLIISSYSCESISTALTTTYGVIFQINIEEGLPFTYQWKRRDPSVSYWTNVGSNSPQYNLAKITSNNTTFEVMCDVSYNGRTGSSSSMMVTIYP